MEDLNDLYYFARVVDYGGFTQAGRALGIPKSRLSRRIALLEERLGTRLIQRSTRHFAVTETGHAFYEHCRAMVAEAEAAEEAIDVLQAEPRGTIRLSCPVALLHVHVGRMLSEFMTLYPKVTIHLEATNRRVDVVGEALDIAIRVRPPPLEDSELVMKVLADRGQCLVASPGFVEQFGFPATPGDLEGKPALCWGTPAQSYTWTLFGPNDAQVQVRYAPRLVTTDLVTLRSAALAGIGIAQMPGLMVSEQTGNGTLLKLVPGWAPRREIIHAVYASRRGLLPSVRLLLDFLAQGFAALDED